MAVKFVEFKSVNVSQRFETREMATAYAVKTMNDLISQGFQVSSMSIHDDYSYSNKDHNAPPVVTGYTASISAASGDRYTDNLYDTLTASKEETVKDVAA